jgi:hypothetical protein
MERILAEMPCQVGYIRCESGLLSPEMSDQIRSMLQLRGPFVELAQGGHHPMLDQPLPLVGTLRTLLEMWSITRPFWPGFSTKRPSPPTLPPEQARWSIVGQLVSR